MAVPQADHLHVSLDPQAVVDAYVQHRRRFADAVRSLDEAALRSPSRCSEWTVADVLRHGCDVDAWMRTIWAGDLPFTAFDPRVTPHESVVAARSVPDLEIRDRYVDSAIAMADGVDGSGPERWGLPSLSPAGSVPWWLSLLHALFDSWVHERDALLPLGRAVAVENVEVDVVLPYVLALVPHLRRFIRSDDQPVDAVVCGFRVTDGEGGVMVSPWQPSKPASMPLLTGDPPFVIDALSGRGSLDEVLTGDSRTVGHLGALARFFTTPV